MRTILRAAVAIALLAAAPGMALDLKGVKLGAVATDEQLKELGCNSMVHGLFCSGVIKLGDVYGTLNVTLGNDQTVDQINVGFESRDFAAIAAAAMQKWGKAKVSAVPISNGFGAKFTERMWTWTDRDGSNATLFSIDTSDPSKGALLLSAHPIKPSKAAL